MSLVEMILSAGSQDELGQLVDGVERLTTEEFSTLVKVVMETFNLTSRDIAIELDIAMSTVERYRKGIAEPAPRTRLYMARRIVEMIH